MVLVSIALFEKPIIENITFAIIKIRVSGYLEKSIVIICAKAKIKRYAKFC